MSCICLPNLKNLIAALLPLGGLATLRLPAIMETLNAHVASHGAPAASSFNARLALSLPALPLSLNMIAQISATATAAAQLRAALGFNPSAGSAGTSGLGLAVSSLNFNISGLLPLLPLLPALPALTRLSLALSTMAALRANFGIDLLAPGAALRINALFGLPGAALPAPRLNMAAVARAQAYASLSAAATAFGGPALLLPSLRLMASLRLPTLPAQHLNLLALLAALLGLRANLTALGLGVNLSASAMASLRLALRPMLTLPALDIRMPASVTPLPSLNASFMASAQAIAALNLSAALGLRLPSLAPLTLLANVTMAGSLGRASACSSSCPVGSRL